MWIEVTAEDIAGGVAEHCTRCPVALAIGRATFQEVDFEVNEFDVDFKGHGFFQLPDSAVEFIHLFDNGQPVEPFSFELPEVA